MRPLRVGLNLFHAVAGAGGSLTYARELLSALFAVEPETEVTAFVTAEAPDELIAAAYRGAVRWERVPSGRSAGPPWSSAISLGSQWAIEPLRARRLRLDVLHGMANCVAPLSPVASVATILDLIWLHYPQAMGGADRIAMQVVARASARTADRLITISLAGRDDLVARLGVDPARVDVTPLGVRARSVTRSPDAVADLRRRLDLGEGRIVLCVAQKRAHKNLDGLVRALGMLVADDAILVLPGGATAHEDELRRLAAARGLGRRVRFLGFLSDADLDGLYNAAACVVLASKMEGFGLPIIEAMQRDVPVACSNVSALPEVAGDAALLFDPFDDVAIAAAIDRLLADRGLAGELVRRGRQRCAELTWERTAEATLASYRRAIAQRTARWTRRGRG